MERHKTTLIGTPLLVVVLILVGIGIIHSRATPAIIHGYDDPDGMAKSVARITWFPTSGNGDGSGCTGSVVGDGWVLTALHCLYPVGDLNKPQKDWHGFTVQLWNGAVNDINKPDYSSRLDEQPKVMTGNGYYGDKNFDIFRDVALMHVKIPMYTWLKSIPMTPINPAISSWPPEGTALTEYGYGWTDLSGTLPTKLQKSKQGEVTRTECPSGFKWTSGQICTKSTPANSSLASEGDSGGPLLWWNNGYWQQVGSLTGTPELSQSWRSYWSEVDDATRSWIYSYVFSIEGQVTIPPYGSILRDYISGASWQYQSDGYRHWIPDGATYNCLKNSGSIVVSDPPRNGLPLRTIEALPDKANSPASCSSTTPAPSGSRTIQISWSSVHVPYIAMTLQGFSSGSYQYTCNFGSGGPQTFNLSVASDPQTIDSGHTCFDGIKGDTLWVTIGSIKSNVLTVTTASPAPGDTPTPQPAPATPTPQPHQPPPVTPTPQPPPHPVDAYWNYGSTTDGRAMCRGNPGNAQSMPGGTVAQTFTVPGGVSTLSSALVQIDPDSTVTAHLSLVVNGNVVTTTDASAAGDTHFNFGPVTVRPGDTINLSISFTAAYGKIITVYGAGSPGGTFSASNSCPAGAPSFSTTSTGLRAVVSVMSK